MKKIISSVLVMAMAVSVASSASVTDSQAAVKGKLNKTKATIATGKTVQLKVKNKGKAKVTFSSSKKKIAKVTSKGKVTGVKKGTATIIAKVKNGAASKKLKCKITVLKGAKTLAVLDSNKKKVTTVSVEKYGKVELKSKITPSSSNDIVKWSTSNSEVASVKNGVVTGLTVGSANVYAKTYSGKKVKVKVNVTAPAITGQLKDVYANDFKIGAAVNTWQLEGKGNNAKAKQLIASQFNSITMENEMKPDALLSMDSQKLKSETEVAINTSKLDTVLKDAKDNGVKLRGHCLVWHSQTPEWFFHKGYDATKPYVDKTVMKTRMENYIKQVMTYCQDKYPDVVYAWDVVNETVGDDGKMRTFSNWYKVYGDTSYITDAFTFARKYAAKDVGLFFNDYNEYNPTKRDLIYTTVKKLYEEGLCDGVGMQSHYTMDYPSIDLVKQAIDKYNSIAPGKIQLQLTELDIHNNANTVASQNSLATMYGSLMKMLLTQKRTAGVNITSVTFWGLTDANTWLSDFRKETSYPLLFSGDFAAKPAFFSVLNAAK